jgi:hypothetical protein
MKRSLLFAFAVICAIFITLPAAGQKENCTGSWKLDREKSTIAPSTPLLIRIKVQVKGDSLLTVRVYDTGDGQEYPFDENVTLDGKEYELNVYNMPRKTKASVNESDGLITVESVTTFEDSNGPQDFVSKETWKADKETNLLSISFKNKTPDGEAEGILYFTKEE